MTPAGNLLVCEDGYDRMQELTGLGEAVPQHARDIPIAYASSIALHGDTLAVGARAANIKLLSYTTGALRCTIGLNDSGSCMMTNFCTGLRVTPDGQFIVAAEHHNKRLSMFRVADGGFVKYIGVGVVAKGMKDVQFAPNG